MGKKSKSKGKKKKKNKGARLRRPQLSLCMIARDEAAFLGQCLQSVAGLVDEIVVVDTGSSDDTVTVAGRAGARVFSQAWDDDFSKARNRSIAEAKGEWILVLDCDEVLAAQDHARLRQLLAGRDADAYRMTTRNYSKEENRSGWVPCRGEILEEKGYPGYFPTTKVRLWRNRRDVCFVGAVHELVEPTLLQAGIALGDCLVPVHHYGHIEKERGVDHYLEVGERKVRDNPDDLRARYELAIAYRNAERFDEALVSIETVVAQTADTGEEARIYLQEDLVLLLRAEVLGRLRRADEALAAYDEMLARFPASFEALNNRGLLLEQFGRLDEARQCYMRGAELAPDNRILADNFKRLQRKNYTLSACIIARDEEEVLGRCLDSLRGIVDEIVVVDTGSVDGTIALAEGYGARIGRFEWCDDFSAARNASLEMATGDWILWLDAGDYLLPEDGDKIRQAKALEPDQALYFTLVNEGGGQTGFRQLKMFPNRADIRFELPVHENVAGALRQAGIDCRGTDVEVHHTRVVDAEGIERKNAYYLCLMNEWLSEHAEGWETCFRIGHGLYVSGERPAAAEYFARILAADQQLVELVLVRRLAATFAGRCLLEDERYEEAIAPLEVARQLAPEDKLTLMSLGDVHVKLGHFAAGLDYLTAAAMGRLEMDVSLDPQAIDYSLYFFTGQALHNLGRFAEAEEAFLRASNISPERGEAAQALNILRQSGSGTGLYIAKGEKPARVAASLIAQKAENGGGRLTLCMIVRDEQERLGHCLDSVQGLVDEIVVVDTGSVDGTVALAESYSARMGSFSWCDDWAAARNVSLALATGDWILWLDADDIMPQECHAEIRRLVDEGGNKSYFFVLDDQGHEQVSCLQMRLFPNLPGIEFEMPVHEQITPSLGRLGLEMIATDIRVVHTGYTSPEVVRAKKERYLGIMERWLVQRPEDYMTGSHVALTYYSSGKLAEAEAAYRYIVEESTCRQDRNWIIYTTALLFLGRTLVKMGEFERAKVEMLRAEEIDPEYILTKLSLAEVNARLVDWPEALRYGRATLAGDGQMTFFPVDYDAVRYGAELICGQAAQALEQWAEAEEAYRRAAGVPVTQRSEALGNLSNMFKVMDRRDEALAVLDEALVIDPDNSQHRFNKGVWFLEARDLDRAEAIFAAAVESQPDFALALLNLGYIAKTRGVFDQAETYYRRAIACGGEGVEGRANLGHLFLHLERFSDAAVLFEEVRTRKSGLVDIELGLLVTRAQQNEGALELLQEIAAAFPDLQREPDDTRTAVEAARTAERLGLALLKRNQIKCAELAFWAAVLLDGNLIEARRALSEVLYVEGSFWKAVAQLEAVLLVFPRDAPAFKRLGDCYKQLGVDEAARLCYAKSQQAS